MYENSPTQSGFIAIISVIIITAILILVAVTLSTTGFYSRSNVLDSEYKERGTSIAESCAEVTFLQLSNNPAYSSSSTTTVGATECHTGTVSATSTYPFTGAQKAFRLRSIYQGTYTIFSIVYDISTGQIVSWEEISKFY